MLEKSGVDFNQLRDKHLSDLFMRFEYTERRKKMSTILQNITDNENGYDKRLHTKGDSEIVLGLCTHYIDEKGNKVELTDELKQDIITNTIANYSSNALTTICLAYRDVEEGEGGKNHEEGNETKHVELNGLTLIGVLGMRDLINPEVSDCTKACKRAGIKIRMITEDDKDTAIAIAKECNIIEEGQEDTVMEGKEFYDRIGGVSCNR